MGFVSSRYLSPGWDLTYPLRFSTWASREMCVFRCARASVSVKETFEVRIEPVTLTTSNVKVLPTELRGETPIDYPAQGNPYNTTG